MRMPIPSVSRVLRGALLALLAAASLLQAGCATVKHPKAYWPPPPEKARIEYVRSFRGPEHLEPGLGRRILSAIVPHDSGATIVSPSGLALSPDEKRLYVACGGRGRVIVVDREKRTMDVAVGSKAPKPVTSVGVAVDQDENIYVADRLSALVLVYDRGGKFLRRIGEKLLEEPTSLAIDRRGQLLYVVSGATSVKLDHRIEVFSLAGKHLRTIGKRGEGPGEFNFPSALAVAADGTLYVSDMLNFRVQQFDRDGQLLGSFGQLGTGGVGAFDKIKGIGFDSFGNVYVVDSMQGVQVLNPDRKPLLMFGAPPFMIVPGPLVIDSKNRIFVADFGLNGVHEFQLVNTKAEDSFAKPEPKPAAAPGASAPAPAGAGPANPAAPAATGSQQPPAPL